MAKTTIAIIGLGYVGLPLARLFSTKYSVIGFDISKNRVAKLNKGHDDTLEVEDDVLQEVLVQDKSQLENKDQGLLCTSEGSDIKD